MTNKSASPHQNTAEHGMYYLKMANKYRMVKWVAALVLAIFVLLSILFGRSAMRGVEFQYLFKYFDINAATLDTRYHDIAYAVGGGASFALYHDDLAVLGEGKIALYDLGGELRFRDDVAKGSISLEQSETYLAAYVPGKTTLSLFHSFGTVFEMSFSSPITRVALSDSGVSAVCLRSDVGMSIEILDRDGNQTKVLTPKDGIVMDMALSPDGKTLLVLSLSASDGAYQTRADFWDIRKEEIESSETFFGRKPIAAESFKDGHFVVLLDRQIAFFKENGKQENTVSQSSSYQYDKGSDALLICTAGTAMLFEKDGTMIFSVSLSDAILDMDCTAKTIYLLSENTILCYDKAGEFLSKTPVSSGALDMFALDDGSILLCYATQTKRIRPSEIH